MLCEKCGTNNPMKADQCFSCGATMPITPCGNGFADILSFDSHPERNAEVICQAQQETEERLRRELSIYKHQRKRLLKQMRIVTALAVVLLILSTVLAISLLRERAAGEQQQEQITKEETVQVPTKEQDSEANSSLPNENRSLIEQDKELWDNDLNRDAKQNLPLREGKDIFSKNDRVSSNVDADANIPD